MKTKLFCIILLLLTVQTPLATFSMEMLDKTAQTLAVKTKLPDKKMTTRKNVFANAENLKVLPENTTPDQLRATMKSFAMALGFRCHNCHVGEPGKSLQSYDFASDEKKLKNKARVMLKMVKNINRVQLAQLDEIEKNSRVEVQCMTCHRGQQKPELIQDVLANKLAKGDINAVIKEYTDLRDQYYGSHTFDFGENVLPMFSAEYMNGIDNTQNNIALLEANKEYFPESFFGTLSLAIAYHKSGDKVKARSGYQKALKLNPKAVYIKQKLKDLNKDE